MQMNRYGVPVFISSTATASATVITSANAILMGALVHGTGTSSFQIANGAGLTVGRPFTVLGPVGGRNGSQYMPMPAYCPSGFSFQWLTEPTQGSITLFWNPAGGP